MKSFEAVIKTTVANVSRYLLTTNDPHVEQTLRIYSENKSLEKYQNCLSKGFAWNSSICDRDVALLPTKKAIEQQINTRARTSRE